MANIKNFGMVGVGTDVQFGKGGARLTQTEGTFAAKNAAGNAFVRFQIAEGTNAGDAVTFGQLSNAVANVASNTAAILAELNAIELGAGLGVDGSYTAPVGSNYLGNATSLFNAESLLDTGLKAEVDARVLADSVLASDVANAAANAIAAQSELDQVETSVGLAPDGTLTLAAGNYLANATDLVGAVETLDGAIGTVASSAANAVAASAIANATANQAALNVANTNANVVTLSARVDAVEATTGGLTNSVVELEANVVTLTGRVDDLEAADYGAAIAELTQDLSDEGNARVAADSLNSNAIADVAADLLAETNARVAADSLNSNAIVDVADDLAALTANAVLKNGSVAMTGALNMGNNVIHNVSDPVLDTDAANMQWVEAKVAALGNAFNYVGVLDGTDGIDAASAIDVRELAADGKNPGDYYKITVAGWFTAGDNTEDAIFYNANDGLVWNNAGTIDKIDNTDSTVAGTAGEIDVAGTVDTGYTVSIDGAYTAARQLEVTNAANAAAAATALVANSVANVASDLADAVSDLEAADTALAADIANTNANAVTLTARVDALETADYANAIADVAADLADEIIDRADGDAALAANIANTNANVVILSGRVDLVNANVSTLSNTVVAAAANLANTNANVSTLSNTVVALTSTVANTNANVSTLSNTVVALSSTVGNAATEINAIELGAGLGADGTYTANATAHYIANATSLKGADNLLDTALFDLANSVANLSQDTIRTEDNLNSVHVAAQLIETKLDVAGTATTVLTVVSTDDTDSKLAIDAGVAGEIALRATGLGTDVDLRLVGQGSGHVIIGETGVGVIQADDGYSMTVAGGFGGGALLLLSDEITVGAEDGTAIAKFYGDANATAFATVTNGTNSVEFGVDGTGSNLDLVWAPKGLGNVSVSNARVLFVGNAVASTDAVNLGQLGTAIAAAEVGHVKTIVATLTETNGAVTLDEVTGTVLRIRVLITGAFNSGVTITVGSAEGTSNELAGANDIDEGSAGIYIVDTAKDYVDGTIQATIAGAVSGTGSAKVYVEYMAA
jgi:hypothetical protein